MSMLDREKAFRGLKTCSLKQSERPRLVRTRFRVRRQGPDHFPHAGFNQFASFSKWNQNVSRIGPDCSTKLRQNPSQRQAGAAGRAVFFATMHVSQARPALHARIKGKFPGGDHSFKSAQRQFAQ